MNSTLSDTQGNWDLNKSQIDTLYSIFCANKNALHRSIRNYVSKLLIDTSEDKPLECNIEIEDNPYFSDSMGLSHSTVKSIWQEPGEGWIYVELKEDDGNPIDFDDLSLEFQYQVFKGLV